MAYQPSQDVGFISLSNSSTTPLAANATFTGPAEDVTLFPYISVTVFADQVSANDGFQIQQSSNGINWDLGDTFSIPAGIGKTFTVGRSAKFARVVYTNGAIAQAAFRLQTVFSRVATKDSSVKPQDGRGNDNDFTEALAFGMVWNGTSWDRLRGSTAGMSVVPVGDAGALFRGRATSFRMLGRAGTTPRRLAAMWNPVGSGRTINVGLVALDILQTAIMAVATIPPVVRVYKISAAPTGGTAMVKTSKDIALIAGSSASIVVLSDASADGVNSATALAATTVNGTALTQEFAPRLITAAGYEPPDRMDLLTSAGLDLRPGEGMVLTYDLTGVTQEPVTTHTIVTLDWFETL